MSTLDPAPNPTVRRAVEADDPSLLRAIRSYLRRLVEVRAKAIVVADEVRANDEPHHVKYDEIYHCCRNFELVAHGSMHAPSAHGAVRRVHRPRWSVEQIRRRRRGRW